MYRIALASVLGFAVSSILWLLVYEMGDATRDDHPLPQAVIDQIRLVQNSRSRGELSLGISEMSDDDAILLLDQIQKSGTTKIFHQELFALIDQQERRPRLAHKAIEILISDQRDIIGSGIIHYYILKAHAQDAKDQKVIDQFNMLLKSIVWYDVGDTEANGRFIDEWITVARNARDELDDWQEDNR